jgi:hypothetical protein
MATVSSDTLAPLATAADYKAITGETAPDDLVLEAASSAVRAYCGWPISEVSDGEVTLDGTGVRMLRIPAFAVTDVASVDINGETVTDYTWSEDGILERRRGWPAGRRNVVVVFTAGHDPVPPEVIAAVASVAGRAGVPAGLSSTQIGSVSLRYQPDATGSPGIGTAEARILGHYRIPRSR